MARRPAEHRLPISVISIPAHRRDVLTVGEHPVGLPELTDDLLRGVTLPAVRHDLTSLPARDRGQQDDPHNDWTYETGSAHWQVVQHCSFAADKSFSRSP